jgi:hypothetical protein
MMLRLVAGLAAFLVVVIAIDVGRGDAEPPGNDPSPHMVFSVHPAAGRCVPKLDRTSNTVADWERVQFLPPAMGIRYWPVELICPLDVGPGILTIKDIGRTRVYGFNSDASMPVKAKLCVFDLLAGGPEKCGNADASGGLGDFVITAIAPDVSGMSDRTAAYLRIEMTQGYDEYYQTRVDGFVVEAP